MFCHRFFFHAWEKWKLTAKHNVVNTYSGKEFVTGRLYEYQRECMRCGKVQHKKSTVEY